MGLQAIGEFGGGGLASEPKGERGLHRVVLNAAVATAVLPLIAESVWIFRASHFELTWRLPDDAYYYLEIARRLGHGEGFTFDGLYSTNGFHPLWQMLLIPVSWITPPASDLGVRASLLLGLVLIAGSLWLLARQLARLVGPVPAAVAVAIAIHGPVSIRSLNQGMEAPAVILALALLLTALARAASSSGGPSAGITGLASAVLVLARLDYLAVVWLVPVALGIHLRRVRPVAAWAIGFSSIGLPTGLLWLYRFRHFLTTSATIKAHQEDEFIRNHFGSRVSLGFARYFGRTMTTYWKDVIGEGTHVIGTGWLAVFGRLVLVLVAVVGIHALWHRRAETLFHSPGAWALRVISLTVIAKFAFDIVFSPHWAIDWYSAPQRVLFGLALGSAVGLGLVVLMDRSVLGRMCALAAAVITLVPLNLGQAMAPSQEGKLHAEDLAADWILARGEGVRYGSRDAGLIGYRVHGHVEFTNLDGLVNDYDLVELVIADVSIWGRAAARSVDIYVGRVYSYEHVPSCTVELWRSPIEDDAGYYVAALDLQGCRT